MRKKTGKKHLILAAAFAIAATLQFAGAAHADTIADVKLDAANSGNDSTISSATVTYIISSKAFLVQDATGADEIYIGTTNSTGYTPTVGDDITASGNSYNYHGLYELESYTADSISLSITEQSSGNSTPTPDTFTTETLQNGSAIGASEQSELGTLGDVTFNNPSGNFTSGGTYTVTDGVDTATVYVPSGDPLIGTAVPTSAVNIYGYLGQYDSADTTGAPSVNGFELDALSVSPVPEPASFGAMALIVGFLGTRRRQ